MGKNNKQGQPDQEDDRGASIAGLGQRQDNRQRNHHAHRRQTNKTAEQQNNRKVQLRVFDEFDHKCCWEKVWPMIVTDLEK